jgi:predicted Zn-dependent protease
MNTNVRIFTLFLTCVLLAACATSPTGRRQLMLVSEESAIVASSEAYLSTVNELSEAGKISEDAATNKRVKSITGQLITEAIKMRPDTSEWDWSVVVIDDPEMVNAWCMAGGKMAIYTGLLEQVQPSDDELAHVMGHEISHALAKHSAEKMSVQLATSVGVAVVGIASDNTGVALTGAALTAMLVVTLPNSRSAEKEADRIGISHAVAENGCNFQVKSAAIFKYASGARRPAEEVDQAGSRYAAVLRARCASPGLRTELKWRTGSGSFIL